MNKVIKHYFGCPKVIFYYFLFAGLLLISYTRGLFSSHLIYFFLPIPLTPFYEWVAHKYLLHKIVSPEKKGTFQYQYDLHYGHHEGPSVIKYIFAPLSASFILFAKIFLLFGLFGGMDWKAGFMAMTGAVMIFLYYEWVHLSHHIPEYKPLTRLGKKMKKAHMWHHYVNENYWWGITSHFGDLAFGTFPDPSKIPLSHTTRLISESKHN